MWNLKKKLKICNGKINTYFYGKNFPKPNYFCYCLETIGLDNACKIRNKDDKYYIQIYLEEQNYEEKDETQKRIKKPIEKKRKISNSW